MDGDHLVALNYDVRISKYCLKNKDEQLHDLTKIDQWRRHGGLYIVTFTAHQKKTWFGSPHFFRLATPLNSIMKYILFIHHDS